MLPRSWSLVHCVTRVLPQRRRWGYPHPPPPALLARPGGSVATSFPWPAPPCSSSPEASRPSWRWPRRTTRGAWRIRCCGIRSPTRATPGTSNVWPTTGPRSSEGRRSSARSQKGRRACWRCTPAWRRKTIWETASWPVSCSALDDAHLPEDAEFRRVVRQYMEWAVREVHAYNPRGSSVPAGMALPQWSWDGLGGAPTAG